MKDLRDLKDLTIHDAHRALHLRAFRKERTYSFVDLFFCATLTTLERELMRREGVSCRG
jgi:hypothetical protein